MAVYLGRRYDGRCGTQQSHLAAPLITSPPVKQSHRKSVGEHCVKTFPENASLCSHSLLGLSYRVFCLLGDGEMSEGSVWEAMSFASYYQLDNLVAIMDINRLGQTDSVPLQHYVEKYQKRCEAFGYASKKKASKKERKKEMLILEDKDLLM